jgi:preprotein translocase subunit SecB
MTDQQAAPEQQFRIQKVYIKDASLESPNAPALFTDGSAWKPEVNLQLNSETTPLAENQYEVMLTVTVTVKVGERTAYLVEVKQAGLFVITGMEQSQLQGILGAYCPNVLFPFAREAISDLAVRAGFPQMLLDPINFDALYAQHLQQQQAAEQGSAETLQ